MAVLRKCDCPAELRDCAPLRDNVQWYTESGEGDPPTCAVYASAPDLAHALGVSRPAVTSGVKLHAMSDGVTLLGSEYTFAPGNKRYKSDASVSHVV